MDQSNAEKSYKKNLYSAMTTRVIKQQENAAAATNLNKSQILQLTSQRSMTHLNSM